MNQNNDNLEYVKQILQASRGPNSVPSIYAFWGCVVFIGFAVLEFIPASASTYWLIAAPLGMVISAWLGIRSEKKLGQMSGEDGSHHLYHFGLMVGFIFLALFTQQYHSILLLIGLGYCLAGLYIDRIMLVVGAMSALIYVAIFLGLIKSNLLVGAVFALGFFASAWAAAKLNADSSRAV